MNRKTVCAAPAAIAAMPAAASAVAAQREPWSPYAIRERIALVVETVTRASAGVPVPITEQEPGIAA